MMLRPILATALSIAAAELATAQLVVGTNSGSDTFYIGLTSSIATPIFGGVGIFGLAADDAGRKIYATDNMELYEWDYNSPSPPVLIGTIMDGFGAGVRVDGLTWANGGLYGCLQFPSPQTQVAIYEIDLTTTPGTPTLVQPPVHVFSHQALALGGMGFNPGDGLFYVMNDQFIGGSFVPGIISVDAFGSGTEVQVVASPPFYNDVDGFTVGNDRCYLMTDKASSENHSAIAVFNLVTMAFEPTIPTPETATMAIASGAAWAPSLFGGQPIGNSYCGPAIPNSSGTSAIISAFGSTMVALNDVSLTAEQLPAGQFGYFLAGQTQGFFNPPGSSGFICLNGNIGRYNQIANIIQGPTGTIALDLGAIPVNPPQAVQAGETWSFQCWYRDLNPTLTSNFTDGLSIAFQ
ncbi:MAG: hypothetical protein GY711_29765 [bacterium]|nr:hypothetical protein [bacterium]